MRNPRKERIGQQRRREMRLHLGNHAATVLLECHTEISRSSSLLSSLSNVVSSSCPVSPCRAVESKISPSRGLAPCIQGLGCVFHVSFQSR